MKLKNFLLLKVIFLSSCSALSMNNIAPGYGEAYIALKNALVGYEDSAITPQVISKIPYASALIQIGKGPKALMILESKSSTDLTWVTADGIYIVTKNGKVIKTSGLINNLSESIKSFNSDNFLNENIKFYYYSYDKPLLNNLKIKSVYSFKGKETVTLFNRKEELILIEESISNEYLGWSQVNKFWIDKDNFIWKSEQYISPKLPKLIIEVTKKPS